MRSRIPLSSDRVALTSPLVRAWSFSHTWSSVIGTAALPTLTLPSYPLRSYGVFPHIIRSLAYPPT